MTSPTDEDFSDSYEFCDTKQHILVTLYANGKFETKDIGILIETDTLEVDTPCKFKRKSQDPIDQ